MSDCNRDVLDALSGLPTFLMFEFDRDELKSHEYNSPQQYFEHFWDFYKNEKKKFEDGEKSLEKDLGQSFRSRNGKVFEIIIGFLLDRESIEIVSYDQSYGEAKLVKPDFVLKIKERLVTLSLKVSVRERWKQADWEAIKFKKAYPDSRCFFVTTDQVGLRTPENHRKDLDLDGYYCALSPEINDMFELLKG